MEVFLCIFIVLLKHMRCTQGLTPPFTEAPSDPTYVVVGSDARLKWNYDHGNVKSIVIQYESKSGSFEILVGKDNNGSVQVNTNEPKSLTDRVTIEGNATLVITAVNTGDSTRYRCEFSPVGGGSTTEGPVRLIVAELPENTTVTPECKSKKEGEAATFKCSADGIPTPELSWYNNAGDKLETKGEVEIANTIGSSSLTIKKVNSRDAGTYTCKANNSAGTAEASGVLAVLYCNGGVKGWKNPIVIPTVKVGMTVPLPCPLFGFPQPVTTWRFPNGNNKIDRFENILHVQIEKDSDIGIYYCSGCGKNFTFELKPPGNKAEHTAAHVALGILIPVLATVII